MNRIAHFCIYCVYGNKIHFNTKVVCTKHNIEKEAEDSCPNWVLGDLEFLKKFRRGMMPCIRCTYYNFINYAHAGYCSLENSRKLYSILHTCRRSNDQGYNVSMSKSTFEAALTRALLNCDNPKF